MILSRGRSPSWMAWRATEKAPEITACEAMTVASVARMTSGRRPQSGAIRKNGLWIASAFLSSSAP